MTAIAALEKSATVPFRLGKMDKTVSLKTYFSHYNRREDGFKYEYVDGKIEKFKTMGDSQNYIGTNLTRFFYQLELAGKVQGSFFWEKDTFLTET